MAEYDLLDEMSWRGLLYQHSERLAAALKAGRVAGYAGFDPTADSLHVGSLVPIMGLVHLQRAGHRPFALIGSGTALIGDPSGKAAERPLMSIEEVEGNARACRAQIERFLDTSGPAGARFVDNADWLLDLRAVEFMRDVGKHFTVNYMVAKDSVRSRYDAGISYTEFSYMLLQAFDYLQLYRREGVSLQLGGSDQWGNITAGMELIRRADGGEADALTMPLVTTAGGAKFGKTEAGTIWLDADRTSPYQLYQFWMNVDDRDAAAYLRMFTLLPRDEVEALERALAEQPEKRETQRALARDVTARVHGDAAAKSAEAVSHVLFGGGDPFDLSEDDLGVLSREIPFAEMSETNAAVIDLFVETGLAPSRSRAKTLLQQGGAYLNSTRAATDTSLDSLRRLPRNHLLLRKGAKDFALVRLI